MKYLISYNSRNSNWAQWIGWTLRENSDEVFLYEWEVGPGQNIPSWMFMRIKECDKVIGIFSPTYVQAIVSKSEYLAAYWNDIEGKDGFLVPIIVEPCEELPIMLKPLRRLSLYDLPEEIAALTLHRFLRPPTPPADKPEYPGISVGSAPSSGVAGSQRGDAE